MKILRGVSSFILSLILAFIIVFSQVSLFINTKLLKPDYYISKFEKHGFYDYLYDSTYKNFGQVSMKSNLPQDLFKNIVTKDWIKEQTDKTIKETVDYMLYKADKLSVLDTKPQSDRFNDNLDNYLKSLNLKMDQSAAKEIESIKGQVSSIIKSQSNFIDINSVSKNTSFQHIRKAVYLTYTLKILIFIITLAVALLLLFAAGSGLSNFTAWIGYSLIAGGFFTFVPSIIAKLSGFMNNIAISEGPLKKLAVAFIMDSLNYFCITGGMALFTGILLTATTALYQGRRQNNRYL